MVDLATALTGEWAMVTEFFTTGLLPLPLLERTKLVGSNITGGTTWSDNLPALEQLQLMGMVSDDAIDHTLRQIAEIAPQLDSYLRRPLAGRLMPFKPVFRGGAETMTPLLERVFPSLESLTKSEVRLVTTRQQLAAALAFLDQGEGGLAAHPDPFTGKPFALVQDGAFRRLVATSPALGNSLDLWIGPRPPDGATSPATVEPQTQDAEPTSGF
jgi:hypothetical protein